MVDGAHDHEGATCEAARGNDAAAKSSSAAARSRATAVGVVIPEEGGSRSAEM